MKDNTEENRDLFYLLKQVFASTLGFLPERNISFEKTFENYFLSDLRRQANQHKIFCQRQIQLQIEKLYRKATSNSSYIWKIYYEYQAILLFKKKDQLSEIQVSAYILSGQNYQIHLDANLQENHILNSNNECIKHFIGSHPNIEKNLEQYSNNFISTLEKSLKKQKLQTSLNQSLFLRQLNYIWRRQESLYSQQKTIPAYQSNDLDVNHNFLKSINIALVFALTSNNSLAFVINLNFKANILKEAIFKYSDRIETINIEKKRSALICFKKCLQQIRFQIDQVNQNYLNINQTSSILKDVSERIHILDRPYKIYEIPFEEQEKFLKKTEVQIPSCFLERKLKSLSENTQKIFSSNYITISNDNIFKEFNYYYEKIQNGIAADLWVTSFEDFIFTLLINEVDKKIPFYNVDPKEVDSGTFIQSLFNYCSLVKGKEEEYGMYLKNIAYSHKLLVKFIFVIIAFQVTKRKVSGTKYDLENYKIPFDCQQLYANFNSLSFKARKAMKKVQRYFERVKPFPTLFQHSRHNDGYRKYAEKVYPQEKKMRIHIREKEKQLEKNKESLRETMYQYKIQKDNLQMKVNFYKKMPCFCSVLYPGLFSVETHSFYIKDYYEQDVREYNNYSGKYQTKTVKKNLNLKCSRCKQLQKFKQQLSNHEKKTVSYISTRLPKNKQDRFIHGFCNGIENSIFRLLQLFLYVHNEKNRQVSAYFNLFEKKQVAFISFPPHSTPTKSLISSKYNEIEQYIVYSSDIVWMLWSYRYPLGMEYSELDTNYAPSLPSSKFLFNGFVNHPCDDLMRQHQIYVNLNKALFEGIENYIGLGSCRIGKTTQFPTLLENLTKRTIYISVFQPEHRYIMHLIWLSVSSITSTDMLKRQDYNQFIKKTIRKFFEEYPKRYTSEDFFCLPILGPIFSFLSKHIYENIDDEENTITNKVDYFEQKSKYSLIQFICQRAYQQYQLLEKDENSSETAKESVLTSIRNQQAFISFSVLCCFTDCIVSTESSLAEYFVKFMLIYKIKSLFFDEGNKYYEAIKSYNFIWQKAIYSNLRAVKKYFLKRKKALTSIVQIIDATIPKDIVWESIPGSGEFIFYGRGKAYRDSYFINLENVAILKNGRQMFGVPEDCKNMDPYLLIFAKKDYQVFPSRSGKQIRMRKNFANFFRGNLKDDQESAFFEFEYELKNQCIQPTISLVFTSKSSQKEEKWLFLSRQVNKLLRIPHHLQKSSSPWFCKERSCIIYRNSALESINNVRMVIFLNENQVSHAHLISPQHYTSQMDELCNPSSKKFEKFLYTQKEETPKSLQILKSIEDQQVIYYLESQRNIKKFWFSRSNLTFEQHPGIGIVPSIFKSYRVSKNPFNHSYLPWSSADQVACLVLEKIEENELNCMMPSIRVLIPNFFINEKGIMKVPKSKLESVNYYIYDLHDSFHDLRGLNRQSQLHLAAILLAINKGIRIPEIHLTGAEYSIKILKSCFSNRPLSEREFNKLKIIFKMAIYQRNLSIILIITAIITITSSFSSKTVRLPFKSYSREGGLQFLQKYDELIRNSKTQYCLKLQRGQIPFREIIPTSIAQILNLQSSFEKNQKKYVPLKIELPNIEVFLKKMENILSMIKQLKQSILKKKENKFQSKPDFPIDFSYSKNDKLSQQIVYQLKDSFEMYLEDEGQKKSIKINQDKLLQEFAKLKQKVEIVLEEFNKIMNWIRLQNTSHRDCVSSLRPFLSEFDYTNLLKNPDYIYAFYPEIEEKQKQNMLKLIKLWMMLKVQQDSLKRITFILKAEHVDKIMLLRQCESPRQQIEGKCYWLCFQVEMKIQIWLSQFQTYQTLMNVQKGAATQLNMGEGKTQTIIPMIILESLYGQEKCIPRVNLLTALFEESYSNYFKFLSIMSFNIPIFQFPFNRESPFQKDSQRDEQVKLYIRKYLQYFSNQMILVLDQSSVHSMILKLRELSIKNNQVQEFNKEKTIYPDLNCFDIFDEVDAQMNPKKSFVYSIAPSSKLDKSRERYQIHKILLEKFIQSFESLNKKKMLIYDQTFEEARRKINSGQLPKGLRLSSEVQEKKALQNEFRQIIFEQAFQGEDRPLECSFYEQLDQFDKQEIREYLLYEQKDVTELPELLPDPIRQNLFAFRGGLSCGILQHCLSLRCNVEFGVPDAERSKLKRVAVPYEAAGIPSKKNEYAQPDVSIILSYLSYFSSGLSEEYFRECLGKLKQLNLASQMSIYDSWYCLLNPEQKVQIQLVPTARAIKLNSASQIDKLFQVFAKNYRCVAFWLTTCVFPSDLIQFTNSITSSSWDHSHVSNSIGFSGTKDNSRLFPPYVELITSENKGIKGTDGKMIDLLISNTLDVVEIEQSPNPQSIRLVSTALNLSVSCIIDAGALLSGSSLTSLVRWIAKSQRLSDEEFKGITFCDGNTWKNYDLNTSEYYVRGTTLQDHETFVIFDEYRTRGSDMKLARDAVAALSLSASLTKDSLMQAIGRLRKLGRDQKLFIVLNEEVKRKIQNMYGFKDNWSVKEKAKAVANWCCMNSIKENKKFMSHNIRLATLHFENQPKKIPFIHEGDTSLKSLYAYQKQTFTLKYFTEKQFEKFNDIVLQSEKISGLKKNYTRYGECIKLKCDYYDDVCQREVEVAREIEEERCSTNYQLRAQNEAKQFQLFKSQFNQHFKLFAFDKKFQVSKSFHQCTLNNFTLKSCDQRNELMKCYYVFICQKYLCMITQRQASIMIQKGKSIGTTNNNEMIARISDLTIQDKVIRKFKLQRALTHAKFYNGTSNFTTETERKILIQLFRSPSFEKREKLEEYVSYFLEKRHIYDEKYAGSSLSSIYQEMLMRINARIEFDDYFFSDSSSQDFNHETIKTVSADFNKIQYFEKPDCLI